MEVVLATKNLDKIKEVKEILKGSGIKIFTLKDFPNFPLIMEDKPTLKENALKKARAIAKFTEKIALADDSGLEVEVLKGAPGVFSSRFAGENATYEDNNRKLLSLLKGIPPEKRGATFRCVIAISDPQGDEKVAEGSCKGKIIEENKGDSGFGYDPLFQPEGFTKTFAQMSLEEKNQTSHRARALKKAKEALKQLRVVSDEL
ncbi:MAG: XTP/dITP diphosphatase [Candidatus Aerophobetes bacterium]|nr:XTP/dITP diphosphatase [Candidatus Aerophobetes bacterium]